MKSKISRRFWPVGLSAALMLVLLLAACGDSTATTAPTSAAATTTAKATTAATTAKATTAPATTAAVTTSAATTVAATTASVTTVVATTAAATTSAPTTVAATTAVATTAATTGGAATTYPLTITDDAKRSVKFDKAPTKIVSLAPSNTELLYALGLGESVAGVDDYSNYPEAAKQKPQVGSFNQTNIEKIVSINPDLVLAAGLTSKQLLTTLEARGLTIVVLNPSNLVGVTANMKLLGQITNVAAKSDAAVGDFLKKLEDVAVKVKGATAKPRVFYELDPTLFTVGPGSFIDDMIQKAGGQNIVTDAANPYPQLSQEVVITKDPEVILLGDDTGGTDSPEKILARPGWSGITAVKNKRIVPINADLVNRPGPRAALGVEALAKALYPDLYK